MPNSTSEVFDRLAAEKINKAAFAAVDRAQMRASLDQSAARAFFCQLALSLEVKPDPSVETADVDGKTIRYNPAFISSLKPDEVHGVLIGHEPGHPALLHNVRGIGMECNECRQIAADLELNSTMVRPAGFVLPPGVIYAGEGQYRDCPASDTFEEHYARLHARHKQGGGQGQPKPGQGGSQPSQDPGKCGSFSPVKDEAQAQQMEAEWRGKIAAAAQDVGRRMQEGKLKGDLPGVMQRWIDAVLNPKPHWRETLRDFTTQSLRKKHDNDWSRQSRRGLAAGLYLPRHKGEELGEIVVAVDVSGSIDQDTLNEFASELSAIVACDPCKVVIVYCDAEIQRVDEWQTDDGPLSLTVCGGGGTSHEPIWAWLKEHDGEPVCVICLSDGYTDFGDAPAIPVLWCLTTDVNPPFGRVVRITE